MALKIYTSNRIEELADIFCREIKDKTKWNLVSNIVVQTQGLEKWLIRETAERNKIFANYAFSNPDGFIGKIHQFAGNYFNYYFSPENIKWKIFSFLKNEEFIKLFPVVANYYLHDDVKRIQLAGKIGVLFDQYQVYRPDMIEAWNSGSKMDWVKDEDFVEQETWQRWLWLQLKSNSNGRYDGTQLKQSLLGKMDSPEFQTKLKNHYPHIHLFGIAVLSDYHWEIYHKLSDITDVSMYITTASMDWFGEEPQQSQNDLSGSCNALVANLYNLLPMESALPKTILPSGNSLLSVIQNDILNNNNELIKKYDIHKEDDSVRIVSSYTPVREVEALYNHLLNEFEKNPDLKGSDVSVQMTDVNLYAPLIKAVFDNAPKKIPYVIADQTWAEGDSIIKALGIFMRLHHNDFKAENVLELFDFKLVRQRFGMVDMELIRQMVSDANIRYGKEGEKEDDTYLFSWRHGLSKLILGYTMKGGENYVMDGQEFFPCDTLEGNDALNIFKLKAFADTLFQLQEDLLTAKTIGEWKDYLLHRVFESLFDLSDWYYKEELDYIYRKLENLTGMTTDVEEKISFDVFQEGLIEMLGSETINSSYTSGMVTFSSILSVRSMPFKHIAVLGMNAGDFPRQQKDLGFDLMALSPMANDRNRKNNDKYLFLEMLISARDQIYLSYIGSSIKDNSDIPPSLLIEELEDYIISGTGQKEWFEERIKYKHPLHASSKVYFQGKKFFTYLGQKEEELDTDLVVSPLKEKTDFSFDEINLADLISFYKDPFKWYYNKTLRIYYNDDAVLLPDEEPFELDHLQKWSLKNELVQLSSENEVAYIKRRKNDGYLPLGNMARAELNVEKESIMQIKEVVEKYATCAVGTEAVRLKFGDSVLLGQINGVFEEGYVHYNVSGKDSQPKYLVETYIKYLALRACGKSINTVFVSSAYVFTLPKDFVDIGEARDILTNLVDVYKQGHAEIIPFLPNAGFGFINDLYHAKKILEKEKALIKAFRNMVEGYPSEYVIKEFSLGYFDHLVSEDEVLRTDFQNDMNRKQGAFEQLSDLLFRKLSTLLTIC